jgi:hypothetical protein
VGARKEEIRVQHPPDRGTLSWNITRHLLYINQGSSRLLPSFLTPSMTV